MSQSTFSEKPVPIKPGLHPGDRMPNFERLSTDGERVNLYDAYCGQSVVLILADAGLETLPLDTSKLKDNCLILVIARPSEADVLRAEWGVQTPVLADDGKLTQFVRGQDAAALVAIQLDANMRVISRGQDLPDEPPPAVRHAPVLQIPRVFEPEFCRQLIDVYHHLGNEASGVLKMVDGRMVYDADKDTKVRREHRVEEPEWKAAVEQRLAQRVLPEIQWAYCYPVTRYEAFKIVRYSAEDGGYFCAHRDNNGPDTAHRRFALTINLNPEEYEGGELRFPEYGDTLYKPDTGSAAVFSCSLAHEALPVTRGDRFALVSFFYGNDSEVRKAEYEDRIQTQEPSRS